MLRRLPRMGSWCQGLDFTGEVQVPKFHHGRWGAGMAAGVAWCQAGEHTPPWELMVPVIPAPWKQG